MAVLKDDEEGELSRYQIASKYTQNINKTITRLGEKKETIKKEYQNTNRDVEGEADWEVGVASPFPKFSITKYLHFIKIAAWHEKSASEPKTSAITGEASV